MPLHYGIAPRWLFSRMVRLGKCIIEVLVDEYGQKEILTRLADPYWFQSLSCILGYDWHSSGTTTVLCATLKAVFKLKEYGLAVAGGKGRLAHLVSKEIKDIGEVFRWSEEQVDRLKYASRMSAKVDNTAIQAGYPLYHHAFFVDRNGRWLVIQQGMNKNDRTARRYHWLSDHVGSYVVEPHDAIVGSVVKKQVLDMTSNTSEKSRKLSVDLVNEGPQHVMRLIKSIRPKHQETLEKWFAESVKGDDYKVDYLYMPKRVDWKALRETYEIQPKNYQELLGVKGIGLSTVRCLALISEIIYGEKPSWKDPIRYSFAYGGKDGVPFPVNRKAMDNSVRFLMEALERAKVGDREKFSALNRLKKLIPEG